MSQQQKRFGRVDLSRLEMASLVKYSRMYRLPEHGKKEDLLYQCSKHFNGQQFMLDDEEVLIRLCRALKKMKGQAAGAPVQPPQTAAPGLVVRR